MQPGFDPVNGANSDDLSCDKLMDEMVVNFSVFCPTMEEKCATCDACNQSCIGFKKLYKIPMVAKKYDSMCLLLIKT